MSSEQHRDRARVAGVQHEVAKDFGSLLFDYAPKPGFGAINAFFQSFPIAWNAVVYAAIDALEHWDDAEWLRQPAPEEYPDPIRAPMRTIRDVVRNVQWFRMGDPRANVVEPQLGYILRNLELIARRDLALHTVCSRFTSCKRSKSSP